jgi:hypothetical protein
MLSQLCGDFLGRIKRFFVHHVCALLKKKKGSTGIEPFSSDFWLLLDTVSPCLFYT